MWKCYNISQAGLYNLQRLSSPSYIESRHFLASLVIYYWTRTCILLHVLVSDFFCWGVCTEGRGWRHWQCLFSELNAATFHLCLLFSMKGLYCIKQSLSRGNTVRIKEHEHRRNKLLTKQRRSALHMFYAVTLKWTHSWLQSFARERWSSIFPLCATWQKIHIVLS